MLRHLFDPYIFVATVHGQILGKSGQIRANQGNGFQYSGLTKLSRDTLQF